MFLFSAISFPRQLALSGFYPLSPCFLIVHASEPCFNGVRYSEQATCSDTSHHRNESLQPRIILGVGGTLIAASLSVVVSGVYLNTTLQNVPDYKVNIETLHL